MDALFEILIELFFELFGELIFNAIAYLFSSLFKVFETNSINKRRFKYVIVYTFFALVLGLLVFSVFTKKGAYIQIILVHFIIMLFVYLFKFINRNILGNKYHFLIRLFTSILHYSLAISIIIATANGVQGKSSALIIVFSSISILIMIVLDIFRIKRAREAKKVRKLKENNKKDIYQTTALDKLD